MKKALEEDLKEVIEGDVRFDPISCRAYSVDASIYEIEPLGIVIPKGKSDLLAAMHIAAKYGVPITARGAATGITGGAIGEGLILDLSKYLNRIIAIDYEEEYAICQPGVVQDQLNRALAFGYRLGPDTSTGNRATIGGMVGNNAAGAHSLKYGKMVDHVQAMEIILATGEVLKLKALDEAAWREKEALPSKEGEIYRQVGMIIKQYREEIKNRFPHIPRRTSGYNLDELIKPSPLNLSKLLVGSEGTLGIMTEVKVKICPKLQKTALCLIHFDNIISAMESIAQLLPFSPVALEMIDDKIIAAARSQRQHTSEIAGIVGHPKALFIAEFEAPSEDELDGKLRQFQQFLQKQHIGYAKIILKDPAQIALIWSVRKGGLGLLLSKRSYSRAIAFIEDISLPPALLAPFMQKFLAYLTSIDKQAGIYGHVGSGCMHIRPYIDLRSQTELQLMESTMRTVADLILEYGGALSGEHGDGYVRSWLNKKMFGENLYTAFCQIKSAFDPENRLNPGKIVHPLPLLHDLRLPTAREPRSIPTFLDFSREGGFELAVDLCNGNGLCRKSETIMCPSFQATNDEYHTTRARAQALRAIVNGRWEIGKYTDAGIHDVLDLCLECKGCKTECPSQVDMAKMKAEFLYQYQEKWGYSLRNRLFGHIGTLYQLAAPLPSCFNALAGSGLAKGFLAWLGITPERNLPLLASERFSTWFAKQPQAAGNSPSPPMVVLFNDTYTEFNQPHIGKAAFTVLQQLGIKVILPPWSCCGRPLISKGLLKHARKKAIQLIKTLAPYAQQEIPIIGLEPSCLFTIKDDLCDLVGSELKTAIHKISSLCTTFEAFIAKYLQRGDLDLISTPQPVLVHGHCHQRASEGMKTTLDALKAVPGYIVSETEAGCCGLAGSFGYEKEHFSISMQIGALKLFPAVDATEEHVEIVANGVSCRSQITQGTKRAPLHIAEAIAKRLQSKP